MRIWSRFHRRGFKSKSRLSTKASATQTDEVEDTITESEHEVFFDVPDCVVQAEPDLSTAVQDASDKSATTCVSWEDLKTARCPSPIPLQLPTVAPLPRLKKNRIRSKSRARTVAGTQLELRRMQTVECDDWGRAPVMGIPKGDLKQGQESKKTVPKAPPMPEFLTRRSVKEVGFRSVAESKKEQGSTKNNKVANLPQPVVQVCAAESSVIPAMSSAQAPNENSAVLSMRVAGPPLAPPPPPPPSFLNSSKSVRASEGCARSNTMPARSKPTIRVWGAFLDRKEGSTRETIWEEFSVKTDKSVLKQVEETFAEKHRGSVTRAILPFKRKSRTDKSIPGLRIRNAFLLSLSVNNFKCPKEDLVQRIEQARWDTAPTHLWKSLKESFPSSDEVRSNGHNNLLGQLDQFRNLTSSDKLDDSYQFCFHASRSTNIGRKLCCVHLLSQVSEKLSDLQKMQSKVNLVLSAVAVLEEHEHDIKEVMFTVLSLVNFLNTGSTNENSPGFLLGSLTKFLQLKGDAKTLAWFVGQDRDLCDRLSHVMPRSVDLASCQDEVHECKQMSKVLGQWVSVWKENPQVEARCRQQIKTLEAAVHAANVVLQRTTNIENRMQTKYCASDNTLIEICRQFHTAFTLILREKH